MKLALWVLLAIALPSAAGAAEEPIQFFSRCQAPGVTLDVYSTKGTDTSRDFSAMVVARKDGGLLPTFIAGTVHRAQANAYRVDFEPFWGVTGVDSAHCAPLSLSLRLSLNQDRSRSGDVIQAKMCLYFVDASVDMTTAALDEAIRNGSAIGFKADVLCTLATSRGGEGPCVNVEILQNQIPVNPAEHVCAVD